jgi:hypothetical protein
MTLRSFVLALSLLPLGTAAAFADDESDRDRYVPRLTCDRDKVDPKSYRLTTRAVAMAVTTQRYDFWDRFDIDAHEEALGGLNDAVLFAARRAAKIDPGNRMAQSILARQYLIEEDPERAEPAWERVMDAGGAVVWTATLYEVDARSYFFVAMSRDDIKIYRFSQMTRAYKTGFYSIPEFPGPDDEGFWAAAAGCIPGSVKPEAVVPWSQVREIKTGNWVLYFKLTQPIRVTSDRGKNKKLDQIKVALHGRTGEIEVYKPVGEDHLGTRGRGPWSYNELVRRTLVKFVDPERRIALPSSKPGVGW